MTLFATSSSASRPPGDATLSPSPPAPGQRVQNLFSGETMTFRQTSEASLGRVVELDLELRPLGAPGGLPHRHLVAERFEFSRGLAGAFIAGQRPRLVRGRGVVEVPPARWHFVLALRRTRARVYIVPGMRFDELLVVWAAIGHGDLRLRVLRRLVPLLREHGCL